VSWTLVDDWGYLGGSVEKEFQAEERDLIFGIKKEEVKDLLILLLV
jgi:hypothetical protein